MQRNPHSYQIATGYRTFYSLSLIYQPITKKRLFFIKKRFGVAARIRRKGRTIIGMSINSRLIFWMKYVRHLRKEIRKRLKC